MNFRTCLLAFLLTPALLSAAPEWKPLFDGKTLTGWKQLGGKAKYEVVEEAIVGTSVPDTTNSFLCTEKDYGDFILEMEVMVDSRLNSGIQYRSESKADYQDGRVHGLQFELDPSDRAWTGGMYEEGRRGWLQTLEANDAARYAFKRDAWNRVRIEAKGDHLRTFLNGVPAGELKDNMTPKGFIALQVHGVGKETTPMSVKWRNIRIMENPGADELTPIVEKTAVQPAPVPENAKVELVQGGFKFTEGPALARDGLIFFTDIPNNRIHIYDPASGQITVHRENTGGANGLMFTPTGALLACEGGNRLVTRQVGTGEPAPIAKEYNGTTFNAPNDLDLDGKGGIYFTDPNYRKEAPTQDKEAVYYIATGKGNAQGAKITRVVDDCVKPNGVIVSLDKKTLYVCDNGANKVRSYGIDPKTGACSNGRDFARMEEGQARGGDGMTIDERGNLYVTAQNFIWVFSPEGKTLAKIEVPEGPANCVFGAKGTQTLYITARTGFYKVKLAVDGRR
jgi:sugar lactone lactonase YvrE